MAGTTYLVSWRDARDETERLNVTRVKIIDGYTTLDDAPRIIAIAKLGSVRDAEFVKIHHTTKLV